MPHPWRKPHPSHGDGRGDLQLWHHRVQRCARIDGYRAFLGVGPGWSWPEVKHKNEQMSSWIVTFHVMISNSYGAKSDSHGGVFVAFYMPAPVSVPNCGRSCRL